MKKITKIQEEQIREWLIEGKNIKFIADSMNLCREVIRRRARKLGIQPFKGKSLAYNLKTAPNPLKQLIIGSLLGDGSFVKSGGNSTGCCLSMAHKKEQYEYIKYKFNILEFYGLVNKIAFRTYTDSRFKDIEYTECRFKSRVNPIFTYVRNKTYINGKKTANLEIIEDIDPLGLAIWYMDDGYVTKNSCILSTCSFDTLSQQRLADFLLGRFGLHFTVGNNNNSLYLLTQDFEKFKSIISKFVIPSMQYKLKPYKERVLYKSDELLESPEKENQQPSTPLTKCEGSETNS